MKVLITGSSTVGKSTVAAELQRRGFNSIDGDEYPELVRLEDKMTGEPVEWPVGYVDWSKYSWNLQEKRLNEVLAQDDVVFFVGIFGNQPDYYHLFDHLIVLTIVPDEYERRLKNRPRREVGDNDQNMADRIRKYPVLLQRFIDSGAKPVDASGTVVQTTDTILDMLQLK